MAVVWVVQLLLILSSVFLGFTNPTSFSHSEELRKGATRSCPGDKFECQNGMCISGNRRCDEHPDCPNKEDEKDCNCVKGEEIQCLNGTCLKLNLKCNGHFDCKAGEDELHCECPDNSFKCRVDGNCISLKEKCDMYTNCYDKSDEEDCNNVSSNESKLDELMKVLEEALRRYLKTYLASTQMDED